MYWTDRRYSQRNFRKIPCDKCGAKKGEHCTTKNGYQSSAVHAARWKKAHRMIEMGRL